MQRAFLTLAAGFAALAVALGAFGVHGLKAVSPKVQEIWHTAVTYQMWHALGLALLARMEETPLIRWCGGLLILGILLFSGSLYLLVLSGQPALGMITPLGGLAFIAAWLLLAWHAWRKRHD
jgi:uncharacterized membrane protein YgdD (TMEM256/DUF423 family)